MNDLVIFEYDEFNKLKEYEGFKNLKSGFGYFYFLEYGDNIKIGSTKKPYTRFKNLKGIAENYGNKTIGRFILSRPHINYRENEKKLHQFFKDFRINNTELFKLTVKEIIESTVDLSYDDDYQRYMDNEEEKNKNGMNLLNLFKGGIDKDVYNKSISNNKEELTQCAVLELKKILERYECFGITFSDLKLMLINRPNDNFEKISEYIGLIHIRMFLSVIFGQEANEGLTIKDIADMIEISEADVIKEMSELGIKKFYEACLRQSFTFDDYFINDVWNKIMKSKSNVA